MLLKFKRWLANFWPVTLKRFNQEIQDIKKQNLTIMNSISDIVDNQVKFGVLEEKVDIFHKDISDNQIDLKTQLKQMYSQIDSNSNFLENALSEYSYIRNGQEKINLNVEKILRTTELNNRYIMEALWAEIFESTIKNSTWLLDKTFSPGRWAVGYQYLYAMYRVLNEFKPHKILELGLGQSTRMISQYANASNDVEHCVIEHDEKWIDFFKNDYKLPQCSNIIVLELGMSQYNDTTVRVYEGFEERLKNKKFDFISIDAPLGGDMKKYSRIDVLPLMPDCLEKDFVILFDDCHRVGELNTVAEMEECLKKSEIAYKKGKYSGKKDCVIICAEHLGFLTTM